MWYSDENLAELFLYNCVLKDVGTVFSQGYWNLSNFLVLLIDATVLLIIALELNCELLGNT